MTDAIKVKYVGKKAHAIDNVAGSRKEWDGHGDVQEVSASQAKTLLKYPDQWELADAADLAAVNAPKTVAVTDKTDGTTTQVQAPATGKALEKMSKPELVAHAKAKFGKDLDVSANKKALIDDIEEFEKTVEPVKQ